MEIQLHVDESNFIQLYITSTRPSKTDVCGVQIVKGDVARSDGTRGNHRVLK